MAVEATLDAERAGGSSVDDFPPKDASSSVAGRERIPFSRLAEEGVEDVGAQIRSGKAFVEVVIQPWGVEFFLVEAPIRAVQQE